MNRRTVKTLAGLIAFGVVLNVILHNMSSAINWLTTLLGVMSPVVMGLVIAFILNIPVRLLEKHVFRERKGKIGAFVHRLRRPLSILISIVVVLAVLVSVAVIVVPQLTTALTGAVSQLQPWVESMRAYLTEYEDEAPELVQWINSLNIDWEKAKEQITNFMKNGIGSAVTFVTTAATSVFGTVTNLLLAIILAINVLATKETLAQQVKSFVRAYMPAERAEKIIDVGQLSNRVFTAFLTGQVTEALILAVLCYLGMLIFRFPYAFLISVVVGVSALVPIFGAWFATAVGAILILTVNPMLALWFIVFFVILQQVEGNMIYPRVVGNQVGLPAMWVLIAITVGGGVLGVAGMMLGVPTFAVAYALLGRSVEDKLKKKGLAGS